MSLPPAPSPPWQSLPPVLLATPSSPFSWFHSGSVAAGPASDSYEPWSSVFASKTILIVGGSTGRQMFDAFVGHDASLSEKQSLMTARCKSFNVMDEKFAHAMRGWSKRVHNCTSPAAQEAGIACSDCHEKCLMPSEKKADGWTDVSVTRMVNTTLGPARSTVLRFSWKAELMTRADEVAFTRRLCHAEPSPDLVLVAKGLHDVFFKPRPTPSAHFHHARTDFAHFTQLLECFPSTTTIAVRAPYDGTRTKPGEGSWNGHSETEYLRATTDALKAATSHFAHRRGGPVVFVDAFARTLQPNSTWRPCDGHHYPTGLQEAVWQDVADAYLAATKY